MALKIEAWSRHCFHSNPASGFDLTQRRSWHPYNGLGVPTDLWLISAPGFAHSQPVTLASGYASNTETAPISASLGLEHSSPRRPRGLLFSFQSLTFGWDHTPHNSTTSSWHLLVHAPTFLNFQGIFSGFFLCVYILSQLENKFHENRNEKTENNGQNFSTFVHWDSCSTWTIIYQVGTYYIFVRWMNVWISNPLSPSDLRMTNVPGPSISIFLTIKGERVRVDGFI